MEVSLKNRLFPNYTMIKVSNMSVCSADFPVKNDSFTSLQSNDIDKGQNPKVFFHSEYSAILRKMFDRRIQNWRYLPSAPML